MALAKPGFVDFRRETVQLAKRLRRKRPKDGRRSLREISAALAAAGHVNERGAPFAANVGAQHVGATDVSGGGWSDRQ